jgi:hypothetical protein
MNTNKKIIFTSILAIIGVLLMQIPFTQIIGSNLKFSLFDFYGPIVGAFTGSVFGIITVLAMQLVNWGIHGFDLGTSTILRFFPMLFAVLYFTKKSRWTLIAPMIAMVAFWIHPEGRGAWYYALYWLIPLATYFGHEHHTIFRALGATFTAHAVGSVLFLYALNLPTSAWIGLIPVVWKERGLMALGITITFWIANRALGLLSQKIVWLKTLTISSGKHHS